MSLTSATTFRSDGAYQARESAFEIVRQCRIAALSDCRTNEVRFRDARKVRSLLQSRLKSRIQPHAFHAGIVSRFRGVCNTRLGRGRLLLVELQAVALTFLVDQLAHALERQELLPQPSHVGPELLDRRFRAPGR